MMSQTHDFLLYCNGIENNFYWPAVHLYLNFILFGLQPNKLEYLFSITLQLNSNILPASE